VTVLTRLAGAFARLTESAVVPTCVACQVPMALRREEAVGTFVVEQLYACDRCGRHVTRVQPWAIPD
jgi:hypothetical protein